MKKKTAFIFLFVFLTSPAALLARDIYVRAGASGDGTKTKPFSHLWQALTAVKPDDIIHVTQGTYNGFLGGGCFKLTVSGCMLLGGYNRDFTRRDPFQFQTILERTDGYRGIDSEEPILLLDSDNDSETGVIVDGFVFDGRTKNLYASDGQIILRKRLVAKDVKQLIYVPLVYIKKMKNTTIRNCIIINNAVGGIDGSWRGTENEISNCFIVNVYQSAMNIDCLTDDGTIIRIKNNTIAFVWQHNNSRGTVQIKDHVTAVIENNVFMYLQPSAIDLVLHTPEFKSELVNNIFFQCQGGFLQSLLYKKFRRKDKEILLWRSSDFKALHDYPNLFLLKKALKNKVRDTGVRLDPEHFRNFSYLFSLDTEKLDMEKLNILRRQMGYSLDVLPPAKDVTGLSYKLENVVPNLLVPGEWGVQPFPAAGVQGGSVR